MELHSATKLSSMTTCAVTLFFQTRLVGVARSTIPFLLLSSVAVAQIPNDAGGRTDATALARYTDLAEQAGLKTHNVFGGVDNKQFIIETTGTGVAVFDYDNDGWPDIFFVNGTTLEGLPPDEAPTNHLYHNNHDGTFTDVTQKAGLTHTGWGPGVGGVDYDNDGWENR